METHLQVLAFIIFHGDKTGTTEGWEGTSCVTMGGEKEVRLPRRWQGGRLQGLGWEVGVQVCQSEVAFYRWAAD